MNDGEQVHTVLTGAPNLFEYKGIIFFIIQRLGLITKVDSNLFYHMYKNFMMN